MPLKQVGIQITNACDGGCIMCSRRTSKREVHHMKPAELRKLVDEIKALGITLPTGIGGVGEPTLHPKFYEMVQTVSEIPWCFGTNCNNLIPSRSHWVVKHRPKVVALSMDAITQDTMNSVRPGINLGVAEFYAKRFIGETRHASADVWPDPQLFVQMVVMNQNVHELDEWVEKWVTELPTGDLRWKLHVKEVIEWPGVEVPEKLWSSKVRSAIVKWQHHPRIQVSLRAPIRPTCRLMWDFAWVMSDGAYSPCCMHSDDIWGVGNALKTNIDVCHHSEKMQDLRFEFHMNNHAGKLCEECK